MIKTSVTKTDEVTTMIIRLQLLLSKSVTHNYRFNLFILLERFGMNTIYPFLIKFRVALLSDSFLSNIQKHNVRSM